MKRSKIQAEIQRAKQLLAANSFKLPMFGYWTLEDWKKNVSKLDIIRQTLLGWDVTDFGGGDFDSLGAVLFTIRNGVLNMDGIGCPYAEKLIIIRDGQMLPLHFHFSKTEDIINRGGGVLEIQVYNSLSNEEIDYESDVNVYLDGIKQIVKSGTTIEISHGNSMTITPRLYHLFKAKKGCGDLIVGEVSSINDDSVDNRFAVTMKRFSDIEEDEPIVVPLVNEFERSLFASQR